MSKLPFIFRTAWRDSRRSRVRLILFISAIVSGVAALTAVSSFSENLRSDIDREARSLLGADLALTSKHPIPDTFLTIFQGQGVEEARVTSFASMVRFPKTGGTRMVDVRALEGNFPFFGKLKTIPEEAIAQVRISEGLALAEHALYLQFGLATGDSIQLGNKKFVLAGDLLSSSGRAGIASGIAPVLYIPMQSLASTELIQPGSRVEYRYYFKFLPGFDVKSVLETHKKTFEEAKIDWETVESRKENVGRAFGDFSTFLNLTGFIALLLGCIGIAGAVQLYIREKLQTVAILRCLGASGVQAFSVYLLQVLGAGLVGGMLGAGLGGLLQKLLPLVLADFLPLESVSTELSYQTLLQGTALGTLAAVLFALPPLGSILSVSPMRTMQVSTTEEKAGILWRTAANVAIGLFLLLTARWLLGNWKETAFFSGGMLVALGVLYGVARLLTFTLRRFFPKKASFAWRQAIANLYRPNNRTVLLSVTIGLGAMLLSTLFLVQNLILRQVAFSGGGEQPNMILFDIQTNQKDSLHALARAFDLPILQDVPVVTIRLDQINGKQKSETAPDTSQNGVPDWIWDREYRVTFRDSLIDSEKIETGQWTGKYAGSGPILVSLSTRMADAAKVKVGDLLTFNVQGLPMEVQVGSIREVDFARIQTNFMVVFPTGVLEKAPQFHVLVSRVNSAEQSVAFQSEAVARYPNISAIDLTQILRSVQEVLTKITFVIRFMAMFSILTGLLVLISSIYQSKYARAKESVLLRTLGAARGQILRITGYEYLTLGGMSAFVGILLSLAAAAALAIFVFKIPFRFDVLPLLGIFSGITFLVAALGVLFSRNSVNRPPLEVLRAEIM